MRRLLVVVAIGCGRVGFHQRPADAVFDAATDGAPPHVAWIQTAAPGYQAAATVSTTIVASAGNLLVASAYWHQANDTITLSDTTGLTWTPLDIADDGSGCSTEAQLWYASVTTPGTDIVTIRQSTRGFDTSFYVMLEDDAPGGTPPGATVPDAMLPAPNSDNCWVGVAAAFRAAP